MEIGQALSRLGVEVAGFSRDISLGGSSDPEIQSYAMDTISEEFPVYLGILGILGYEGDKVVVGTDEKSVVVDKVLLSIGRISQYGLPISAECRYSFE